MSFKNKPHKKLPNSQDILSCITDAQIFKYYLGGLPKKPISSPLRNDKVPSFSLFYAEKYDRLFYKDFATGETGDAFVFVMKLLNYSNITDVFIRIAADFGLDQFETKQVNVIPRRKLLFDKEVTEKDIKDKVKIDIEVTIRPWKKIDQIYWGDKYGLTRNQLESLGIFPVSHYFINGYCLLAEDNAYAFLEEKDGIQTFKIYQPYSKEWKWINNNDFSTWELWQQLPKKGKILIITSSRKDAGVIKTLYPSRIITSCALQSEKVNPKPNVMKELEDRFEEIYILYDNDYDKEKNWGRLAGQKIIQNFPALKQIEIPSSTGTKDISDFREKFGKEKTKQLLKTMILKSRN